MAHSHLKDVEAETTKATGLLIGTLLGGMLVVSSFVVEVPFVARTLFQFDPALSENQQTHHSQMMALLGAVLLGAPLSATRSHVGYPVTKDIAWFYRHRNRSFNRFTAW